MRVKAAHLPVVFEAAKKVRQALAQYCEGPDKVPVSLDDITHAISELHGVKIVARLVPLNSKLLRGMIEIYENEAIITIDAELNTQTTRYVFVKEACHIWLHIPENLVEFALSDWYMDMSRRLRGASENPERFK